MILSPFEDFVEKNGKIVFQKLLLSTTFLVSKILKYNFLVVVSGFLQKFLCFLYLPLSR